MTQITSRAAAMAKLVSELPRVVIAQICRCGHRKSDHEPECGYGWSEEPEETVACQCETFVYGSDLVR